MQKTSARRKTPEKTGARAGEGLVDGVCILCGGDLPGVPAQKDIAISFARKIRETFGWGIHHSVACKNCVATCLRKRAAFEGEIRLSRILALLFCASVLGGAAYLGGFSAWTFVPAALGSAIILLLPYGKYFPKFVVAKES